MPDKHSSVFSPSASSRLIACPGSVRAEREYLLENPNAKTSSPAARIGTIGHDVAERMLLDDTYGGEDILTSTYEGKDLDEFTGLPRGLPPSQRVDIVRACLRYREYVRAIQAQYPGSILLVEKVYPISSIHHSAFGTCDASILILASKKIINVDLKLGRGVTVPVENNTQGLSYTEGSRIFVKANFGVECNDFEFHIFQPLAMDGENIGGWSFGRDTLDEFVHRAAGAAALIEAETNARSPGDKQCRWCMAESVCPPRRTQLARYFGDKFDDLTDDGFEEAVDEATERVSRPTLGRELHAVVRLERYITKVKEMAYAYALDGGAIDGHKLVEGRSRWSCNDPEAVRFMLGETAANKDVSEPPLKSFTELSRLLGRHNFDALVGEYFERKPGRPALVSDDDAREAISGASHAPTFDDDLPDD